MHDGDGAQNASESKIDGRLCGGVPGVGGACARVRNRADGDLPIAAGNRLATCCIGILIMCIAK